MRPRIGALILAVVAGLVGCGTSSEECASRQVPVTNAQGEVYRCTSAEDCPRASRVSLCVTDTATTEECLRCLDTRCVRVTPEAC